MAPSLPKHYFDDYMKAYVPGNMPRTLAVRAVQVPITLASAPLAA